MKRMGDEEQSLQDGEVTGEQPPGEQPPGEQPQEEVAYVDPWVGQYLADYYIIRRIGEGGMGIVYLARHQSLDRLAAVKFLGAHMVTDKAYIERFLNEARGAAKLNHPNIVAVYDAGSIGDSIFYFIMEYIEGKDLGTLLRERRVFQVPEAVGYVRQAAAALGYAHKKRIIHRDIKPDNFMLTNEGAIKVGDLGLAKWISDDDSGGMTQSGVVMGTPYYISPEQVRGSRDVDSRSDIYSLGATLHHMVTGHIPYEGTSPAVIMAMHLNNPVPEPGRVNTALDPDICAIIKKMMAKKVDERYQTMEEVDAVLAEYQSGKMRSAPFVPAGGVALPAAPATEPQQLPTAPPERTLSPNILQSEPGAPVKIASIIGLSIIIAAVILGFFLSSMVGMKGKPAETAAAPVVQPPKPIEIDIPKSVANPEPPKPAPNPEPVVKRPEPPQPQPPHPAPESTPQPVSAPAQPAEKPVEMAKTHALAPEPTPGFLNTPSKPAQNPGFVPMDRGAEPPQFQSSPQEPGHQLEATLVSPRGDAQPIYGQMAEVLLNSMKANRPYYTQDFSASASGELPKGVDVHLVDMSFPDLSQRGFNRKKNEIQVKAGGFRSPNPRCQAQWAIEKEGGTGMKYLRLAHDTDAPQWVMAARFELSSSLRSKKIVLIADLRSSSHNSHVLVHLAPESGPPIAVPVDGQWKTFVFPLPQLQSTELRAVMIGLQGTGDVQIGSVRLMPPPPFMSRMYDKMPTQPMGPGGKRR